LAINNTGQVVGYYNTAYPDPAGTRGFLYDHGAFTTLHHPDATQGTLALGINDAMQVVGRYDDSLGRSHGFVYDHGVYTTLDRPGNLDTELNGINDTGHIVGASDFGAHGFLYRDEAFTSIEVPGASATSPVGINDQGQIVGIYLAGGQTSPFLYDSGVFTTLTAPPGATTVNAFGIKDDGAISGNYHDSRNNTGYGFVLDHGVWTVLDGPPGSIHRWAQGINDYGHVVGYYVDADGATRNFLATPALVDTAPPMVTIAASPEMLWPPNGKLVPVRVSGAITDGANGSGIQASMYQVLDEYGQIQPSGSFTPDADGRYTFTVALQASRRGNDRDGRRYTITVSATDQAGNRGAALTLVTVPHG
jgi:probable HAF family extracellular repeat protein